MTKRFLLILIAMIIPIGGLEAENSEQDEDSLQRILQFLPLNRAINGLHVPRFDEQGRQIAVMTSSEVTRVDEDNFALRNLVIHLFGASEDENTIIETAAANYNVRQDIISSLIFTTITRDPIMRVEGDGMVFDTKRHFGRLLWNVSAQMILRK